MKFGLTLRVVHPRDFAELSTCAEANGFESVWVPDHVVFPATLDSHFPYTPDGVPPVAPDAAIYDPWVVLASVAAATSTIRLGTNVYVLPLRHPLVTARALVTLDHISGGRAMLGAGVGWLKGEFEALGLPFAARGRTTDETIGVLRRLWTEDTIAYAGEQVRFGPVRFEPKPIQRPGIPIHVGGTSASALRRAATLGDGWMQAADAKGFDDLAEKIQQLTERRREAGRERVPFEITSRLGTDLEAVHRCAELGVTRCLVAGPPGAPTKAEFLDWLAMFGESVIAQV